MEIDSTSINWHIKIFDDVLPKEIHSNFLRYCASHENFKLGSVVNKKGEKPIVETNTRNVEIFSFTNLDHEKSYTNIHWCNLLLHSLKNKINIYFKNFSIPSDASINDLGLLKYKKGGFYKFHVDHCPEIPRTLSLIYLINDDYKGGDLIFHTVDSKKEIKIEKIPNRLIIWPSNFLYPHAVTPVQEGVRYSVVAWAL